MERTRPPPPRRGGAEPPNWLAFCGAASCRPMAAGRRQASPSRAAQRLPRTQLVRGDALARTQLLACGMRALAPAFQNDTGREERIRDRALGMGRTRTGTFWLRMRFGARGGLALPRSARKGQNFTRRIPSGGPSSAGVGFGALARPKNRRHRRDAIDATCSHRRVGESFLATCPCVSAAVRMI